MLKTKYFSLTILFLFSIISVQAGGWFYRDGDANALIDAVQIVAMMNDDGSITTTYRLDFSQQLGNFVWIIPLPVEPISVEIATFDWEWANGWSRTNHSVSIGGGAYRPTFPLRNNLCNSLIYGDLALGLHGWGERWGEFHPITEHIFSYDELLSWMNLEGIPYSESEQEALRAYANRNMIFLAMDMQDQLDSIPHEYPNIGSTIPISITYEAEQLELPFMLISENSLSSIPVYLWILADTPFAPENYGQTFVDFRNLRPYSLAIRFFTASYSPLSYPIDNNYRGLRDLGSRENPAFVTEYIGEVKDEYPLSQFDTVTRLYTIIRSDTIDPIFRPAPELDELSNIIDIRNYTDPLIYFGCTNRELLLDAASKDEWRALPSGRDRAFGLSVAIPNNWIRTEVDDLILFAERELTPDEIYRLEVDEILDTPVLAFLQYQQVGSGFRLRLSSVNGGTRYIPFSTGMFVKVSLIANQDDWDDNRNMLLAMIDYSLYMPNYLADDLDYTLLLNGGVAIGYPDTWIEATNNDDEATIYPLNGDDVLIRVRDNTWYTNLDEESNLDSRSHELSIIQAAYPESDFSVYDEAIETGNAACLQPNPVSFETESRIGYLVIVAVQNHRPRLIELTASYDLWDDYQEILLYLADSIGDVPCTQS